MQNSKDIEVLESLFVSPDELAKRQEFRAQMLGAIPLKNSCIHSAVAPNMNRCIVCGKTWTGEQWEMLSSEGAQP